MSSVTASNSIATNSINAITPSTGSISIGDTQTDGILNLGTGASRTATGVINIGNIAGLNQINIETANPNNNPGISSAINIGTANVNKTIKINSNSVGGSVSITDFVVIFALGLNTITLQSLTPTRIITLAGNQTTTALNLGTGASRTATGDINIATGASNLCAVNIMNGATTGGSVNIANGTGVTQSTNINIGSTDSTGTVNILSGTGSSMNIANGTGGRTITIGNGTNVVNVANIQVNNNIISSTSGGMTLGGSGTTVNVAGNLTLGTGKNITLAPTAGIVAPTAFTMLGGTSTTKPTSFTLTLGSGIVVIPVQITRAGTYLFTCGAQLTYTLPFTYFYSNIFESSAIQTVNTLATAGTGSGTLVTAGNFGQAPLGTVSSALYMTTNGTLIYTVPEAKVNFYYSFVMYVDGGGTLGTLNSYMTITRLA